MSVFGFFLVRFFPHSDWIQRFAEQISVFSPNAAKCGPEKLRIWYSWVKVWVLLHKKMKFSIKDFFSKCDQIRGIFRIWSHLLKKSLMENLNFLCSVKVNFFKIQSEVMLIGWSNFVSQQRDNQWYSSKCSVKQRYGADCKNSLKNVIK